MEIQHYADVPTAKALTPRGFARFYNGSGSTIARGDAVAEDLSISTSIAPIGTAVKQTTAATGGGGFIGIAAEAIPTGTWGLVQVSGIFADDASIDSTNVAAGSLLVCDATTAGRLTIVSGTYAATHLVVGRCLVDDTDNTGTVRLFNVSGVMDAGGND